MKTIVCLLTIILTATVLYAGNGDLIVTGSVGVGETSPSAQLVVKGAGQATASFDTAGALGGTLVLGDSLTAPNNGGAIVFSAHGQDWKYAAIKGLATSGNGNGQGNISISTRRDLSDATLTEALRVKYNGNIGIGTVSPLYNLEVSKARTANDTVFALGTTGTGVAGDKVNLLFRSPGIAGTVNNVAQISSVVENATGALSGLGFYTTSTGNAPDERVRISSAGNVGIGTTNFGTGGVSALLLGNGAKPSGLADTAGIYARDVGGFSQLFAFNENGEEKQISAHAQDAPDWLYDEEDGSPMLVKEIQHFLGYVRYTNQTRSARLAGMVDAEKQSLDLAQRTCIFKESFQEHEARTGEKFTVPIWEEEQAAIKGQKDAERQAALDRKAELAAGVSARAGQAGLSTGEDKQAIEQELGQQTQQLQDLKIPEVYEMKPMPARLRAALGR